MADGFIVRRGGITDATPAPTISFVSKTEDSVTFTITNNSLKARDITYGLTTPPTTTTINLLGGATSANQTISNITEDFVTIFAQAEDSAITEFRVRLKFSPVFTAATGGTTEEYNLDGKRYKSHTFTSNGTFTVTTAGNGDRNKVDYLIIAGGGGGRLGVLNVQNGGGGGAGGYRTTFGTQGGNGTLDTKPTVTATSYSVTIGAGGSASSGSDTTVAFSSSIVSTGGGFGGSGSVNGANGGSGGGGGTNTTGGTGTTNQGTNGGNGATVANFSGGGGGGAGQAGTTATNTIPGHGGNGLANILRTGSSETRAGGGGGGNSESFVTNGGTGGGGNGARSGTNSTAGTANTGSGGGGGYSQNSQSGAAGGSGIVVIRYEIAPTV
jgi:hypothetical protein